MTGARVAIVLALLLGGCGGRADPPASAPAAADWRRTATPADRERVRNWRPTWLAAVAAARRRDEGAIARDPALFDADRALAGAMPPAGSYRCRVVKLGSRGATGPGFVAYPTFDCRIDAEGEVASFYKVNGSQRPVGLLFPERDGRVIFLGTLVLGDETKPLQYGRDASRDMVGIVTRIGERRWRLALPEPRFESRLDLIELIPAD